MMTHIRWFLLLIGGLQCLLSAGCSTYRVTDVADLSESEAIQNANELLNRSCAFSLWNDSLAGKSGFVDRSSDRRGTRRSYAEIESVEVHRNFGMLLACGLVDPTLASCVVIRYKDTSESWLQRDPYGTYLAWLPFYLFAPAWTEVDRAAKWFERLRCTHSKAAPLTDGK